MPTLVKYKVPKLFGNKNAKLGAKTDDTVIGLKWNDENKEAFSGFIPEVDNHYLFRREVLRPILAWHRIGNLGLFLFGETGTGKSSLVSQVAARLKIPLMASIGHQALEIQDLIGGLGVKSGTTYFREGPLTTAVRHGFWYLLDEIDLLNPGTATSLNQILDGRGILIPETGEFVKIHPFFRFIATGNTVGDGLSRNYMGTQKLNLAFLDRFLKVSLNYPTEEEEVNLLKESFPNNHIPFTQMVRLANDVRRMFNSDNFGTRSNVTMSTRSIILWVKLATEYENIIYESNNEKLEIDPLYKSLEIVCLNSADQASREAIISIFKEIF
jgi:cobaltochelatase CobS